MTANMDKKSGSRRRLQLGRTLNRDGVGLCVASNREPEASDLSTLMDCIHKWIAKTTTPEFMKFKRDQIGYVLADDFIRKIVWPN
ncbi:MAG: hypothetical protein JOZ58_20235 [Acetobacteraceae bacterium]|nr:hypothetical protein [Alphaproteobacteria bacterium]MBV8577357.1 hypothetical protein [Acetobacteraceae bacterium]